MKILAFLGLCLFCRYLDVEGRWLGGRVVRPMQNRHNETEKCGDFSKVLVEDAKFLEGIFKAQLILVRTTPADNLLEFLRNGTQELENAFNAAIRFFQLTGIAGGVGYTPSRGSTKTEFVRANYGHAPTFGCRSKQLKPNLNMDGTVTIECEIYVNPPIPANNISWYVNGELLTRQQMHLMKDITGGHSVSVNLDPLLFDNKTVQVQVRAKGIAPSVATKDIEVTLPGESSIQAMNHLIRGLDGLEQLNATRTSFILESAHGHLRQLTRQLSGYRGYYRRTVAQYVKGEVTKILNDALAKCGRIQRYACKDNSKEKGMEIFGRNMTLRDRLAGLGD